MSYIVFIIIGIAVIADIIFIATINQHYFRHGLLVYKRVFKADFTALRVPEAKEIASNFAHKFDALLSVAELSNNELALAEKFGAGIYYSPVVHAYLKYDSEKQILLLKCFSNFTAPIFVLGLGFLIVSSPIFGFTSTTFLGDILMLSLIFGFIFALLFGIAVYQIQRFRKVIDIIIGDMSEKGER